MQGRLACAARRGRRGTWFLLGGVFFAAAFGGSSAPSLAATAAPGGLRHDESLTWVKARAPRFARRGPAAHASVESRAIDAFPVERRGEGDGADRFGVPADAAEPLYVVAREDTVLVWWSVWTACAGAPTAAAALQGNTLTLRALPPSRDEPCLPHMTLFETRVRGWGEGIKELRSEGAPAGLSSRWLHVPDEPRAGELQLLAERIRDSGALRRLGERIAWAYHVSGQTRASSTAYRWLSALDELHPRAVLYQARLFEGLAFSHSRGAALLVLDRLVDNLPAVRKRVWSDPSLSAGDIVLGRDELLALDEHLERALRYLAQLWHHETLDRWHTCLRVYGAYVQLFPEDEHVRALLPDYASALLAAGDTQEARRMFLRAASMGDEDQRAVASTCAAALDDVRTNRDTVASCRRLRPSAPPKGSYPTVSEQRFARPDLP